MPKKLVIVESPAKAKTIGKMLGSDYEVKASVGHIRDLPLRTLSVDIENGFKPKYEQMPGKAKVVEELKKSAKNCDEIFLASDPDREGEAIAWHLREVLAQSARGKPFHRVQYNEITPRAVRAAFDHPGEIDMARVDAQQARRVLDRIVGYKVSPMLWRTVRRGLSAGRVQSVALRLVCEREREIQAFKPVEYWILGAQVAKRVEPRTPFGLRLARVAGEKADIKSGEAAKALLDSLAGKHMVVSDIRSREVARRPLPPFTTSTLQQAASSVLGIAPGRTMSIAQRLYEGVDVGGGGSVGLITYMRTDSVNVSRDAQDAARSFVSAAYGDEFLPDRPNFYKGRTGAQEAHEAIRPTDVTRTPEQLAGSLDPQSLKLYDLIWRRFVASQMAAAKIEQRTVVAVPAADGQATGDPSGCEFSATASQVVFQGFMKVMALDIRRFKANASGATEEAGEDDDENIVERLPALEVGEPLDVLKWDSERKETKPPARFSEASLVKELESNGIGRPSTYAAILETLVKREYVSREKRSLAPTELGFKVNDQLVSKLDSLFGVKFTADMETELDKVEEGKVNWTAMLSAFYDRFQEWMAGTKTPPADMSKVTRLLDLLSGVKEWLPGRKRGKRVYGDGDFVDSVRDQIAEGEKAVSEKQLVTLARIAMRYVSQLPDAKDTLREIGLGDIADDPASLPPPPSTLRKLELAGKLNLEESMRKFIDSLSEQAKAGRRLTDPQLNALNRVIAAHAKEIPGFDEAKGDLDLPEGVAEAAAAPDTESGPLLEAMAGIKEWHEPVTRGKRVFDDAEFFRSVSEQFKLHGALSERQRFALKRILLRYKDQIKDFDALAEKFGIQSSSRRGGR